MMQSTGNLFEYDKTTHTATPIGNDNIAYGMGSFTSEYVKVHG